MSEALEAARRSTWKRLLPALALSLMAHALLLLAPRLPHEARMARPVLVVTLRPAAVARPAALPEAPSTRVPEALHPPQPTPRTAPAALAAPPPLRPAPQTAASREAPHFHPAEELSQAPLPLGTPDVREIAPRLVGRRLQARVWIDAAGAVQKAEVTRNELHPELAEMLEQAVAQVRFSPGILGGEAAAALLRLRLCFDEAGQFDATSEECWKAQPAAAK